jgi:hypothetical protein
MNKPRSIIATLVERAERFVFERLPLSGELRRDVQRLGAEVGAWQRWATRLVLAERWARCAAEHDRGSHWRTLLSAYAVAALLADDLVELERDLGERAKAAEQFDLDPVTGEKVSSPDQQVGIVFRAILEELIAAKNHETRHYYDPVRLHDGDALQATMQTWDRHKLAIGSRDLVTSATNQAITIATQRLGPAAHA